MDTRMHVIETQHWKLVCVTNLSIDSIVDVGCMFEYFKQSRIRLEYMKGYH
jgi:hypothetical protein